MKYSVALSKLPAFAEEVFENRVKGSDANAFVIALSGELGAGKTAFVKELARRLGVREAVTSPTFVIQKTYPIIPRKGFTRLVHVDAYRINEASELTPLKWGETLRDPENLVCVEWAEKIAKTLPAGTLKLSFVVTGDRERAVEIAGAEDADTTKIVKHEAEK